MNKKKLIIIILVLLFLGGVIFFLINNISITTNNNNNLIDYTPQEEISDKQMRQTSITLYYLDKQTNQMKSQIKNIDSNELLKNPYITIVKKLLEGPTLENLISPIPEGTKLIDANLQGNTIILNFSEEILNFQNDVEKYNIINSLLNSLAQLNEVNAIKILVNNEINSNISQEYCV